MNIKPKIKIHERIFMFHRKARGVETDQNPAADVHALFFGTNDRFCPDSELVFEFTIWFDVMGTRKFPKPTNEGAGDIEFVDAVGAANFFSGAINEQHMLFPLPEQELQRNPSLTQNPGYAN